MPALTRGRARTEPRLGAGGIAALLALFRRGQLRWTVVGILCSIAAGTAYYACAILLPKALVDQGAAVSLSFGLSSLLFMASIAGQVVHRLS